MFRSAGREIHYLSCHHALLAINEICEMFDRKYERDFEYCEDALGNQNTYISLIPLALTHLVVTERMGPSPYCVDCKTPYFNFFSCEGGQSNPRCYWCTVATSNKPRYPHLTHHLIQPSNFLGVTTHRSMSWYREFNDNESLWRLLSRLTEIEAAGAQIAEALKKNDLLVFEFTKVAKQEPLHV